MDERAGPLTVVTPHDPSTSLIQKRQGKRRRGEKEEYTDGLGNGSRPLKEKLNLERLKREREDPTL